VTRSILMTMTVLGAISMAGCARMSPASMVYCQIEKPITWSKSDSTESILEIKEHNAVWKSQGCKL
jgi:hypothetical protein